MNKVWHGKWIVDPRFNGLLPINVFHKELDRKTLPHHKEELKNNHMLVRKKFYLSEKFNEAHIDISADDYYKLYINGNFVGQGPSPSYYFNYYYNTYDISPYLVEGENVIAVHVYYQGLVNRVWNSGDYRQGMIAELFINNRLHTSTDASWKYTAAGEFMAAETIGYETQYLENIDERFKLKNWREIDFNDNSWSYVSENINDDHKLYLQPSAPLSVYEIKPRSIYEYGEGHYLIDFGQEITGQFKMEAKGEKGQTVEIRCGEELNSENTSVRYNLRCNCRYQEFWTLSGERDVLEHFDYKAFRYVEVLNGKNALKKESFSAMVRHYPFNDENCIFKSSDNKLEAVWNICKNGVKYGTQEVYVDCPTREKGQYLGDFTVTSHAHAYLSGELDMFKKALMDFAASSFICPGLMAVAPGSFMQEIADFSLQFPLQLLNYYRQSGDREFLKEIYPVVEGVINYFNKYKRDDGLLHNVKEKWNLVDWPQNLRDDYDFDLSSVVGDGCHNVINAFYCGAIRSLNEIRDILKIKYEDSFPKLRNAFINTFYNKKEKLFVDAEASCHTALHSNVIPLFYGLVPEEAVENIVEFIKKKRLCCGVYNSYFLLKALAKAGAHDTVYELITCEDDNSWMNMIREGATTCFEAWGKDKKWNTSLCHPWASAPISVIIEDIIGLSPAKPGWEAIKVNPHIPEFVESISINFSTNRGSIAFSYIHGEIKLEFPDGMEIIWQNCHN